jgi:hypothetical protein
MANKQLITALCSTTAYCALTTAAFGQDTRNRSPRTPPPNLEVGPQVKPCDVIVEVDSTDPEQRGHLQVRQWIRLIGPIAPQGHMVVLPANNPNGPAHHWRPGLFVAYRTGNPQGPPPWTFFVAVPVLSAPEHTTIERHHYVVTVNDVAAGCPSDVDFDTLPHEGEIIDDHPGHAHSRTT